MTSVFTENLRVYNAQQFIQSVSEAGPTSLYLTFGRTLPWANDSNPPQANSQVSTYSEVWANMIGAKLISGNDIRHAIPRNNWTANTVYYMYDNDENTGYIFSGNVQFFVVTSDWNVYKCLYNNNGAVSSVMPTQTVTDNFVTESDGYIWKYMYTVSSEERLRFVTSSYIPVRTLTVDNNSLQWRVQQSAVTGAIDVIEVTNGGNGYSNANTITVSINGDGTGAQAVAVVNTSAQTISSIVVTNPGVSYTYGTITITDTGTGANAVAHPCLSPPGGHGSDPLRELGGSYVIMNPRINRTEDGKLPATNEFREIAIFQDPLVKATGLPATDTVYTQTLRLTLSTGSTNYILDETVYQGPSLNTASFSGSVVAWDSGNNLVHVTNTTGTIQADVLVGANSAAARFVESVQDKDLQEYSGNLLYIDNVSPVYRADDQTEDFKIVLKF